MTVGRREDEGETEVDEGFEWGDSFNGTSKVAVLPLPAFEDRLMDPDIRLASWKKVSPI